MPQGEEVVLYDKRRPAGRRVKSPRLPANRRDLACYTVAVCEDRLPVEGMADPEVARDAQEILTAGIAAARSGKAQRLR